MTVRIAVFRREKDRRAWKHLMITQSQQEKLFLLFGAKFRVTSCAELGGQYTAFVIKGTRTILTRRGRVVSFEEMCEEINDG